MSAIKKRTTIRARGTVAGLLDALTERSHDIPEEAGVVYFDLLEEEANFFGQAPRTDVAITLEWPA